MKLWKEAQQFKSQRYLSRLEIFGIVLNASDKWRELYSFSIGHKLGVNGGKTGHDLGNGLHWPGKRLGINKQRSFLGKKHSYLIIVLFGGKILVLAPVGWSWSGIFLVWAKRIYIWTHCEGTASWVKLLQLCFFCYIFEFPFFTFGVIVKEGEVPTGHFGFSFHHFVKWKRSCMHM